MNILGIESSCDETACAIVKDGREVLTNVVYTQIPLHQPYGGVVPEVASRAHIEKIHGVVAEAMRAVPVKGTAPEWDASQNANDKGEVKIDAVAVTYGPGLASSLLVGLNAAKGLAMSLGVPLYGINHIEAHLHTPFLYDTGLVEQSNNQTIEQSVPALGLAVSGGHTTWVDMPSYGEYRIIGQTLDDAAGEAFDKAAKLLGLGYPGGPVIDRWAKAFWLAREGDDFAALLASPDLKKMPYPKSCALTDAQPRFPKGAPRAGTAALAGLDADLCVSFSGLKTALLYYVKKNPPKDDREKAGLVAAYQEAIVGAIADRTRTALRRRAYKALIVGGGVSLNGRLRARLAQVAESMGVPLLLAKPKYCGDNAAMIAGLAYYRRNLTGDASLTVDVNPALQAGD